MTQEDKQLLLKDLCARLPYGIKCKIAHSYKHKTKDKITQDVVMLTEISHISPECYFEETDEYEKTEGIKPYLRPMSSMTGEERKDYELLCDYYMDDKEVKHYFNNIATIDWYHQKHFDCRGLIKLGLALEAPEGMYK